MGVNVGRGSTGSSGVILPLPASDNITEAGS